MLAESKERRISDRGDSLSKAEGRSRPQEGQAVSLTEERGPGQDYGRISNSEQSPDPGLTTLWDTRYGKVIGNIKLTSPALTERLLHFVIGRGVSEAIHRCTTRGAKWSDSTR